MSRNAASEADAMTAQEMGETKRRQRQDDVCWLMGDQRGRRIVWQWLETSSPFQNAMTNAANQTFFNLGRQSIGQATIGELHQICPELYLVMQKEAAQREKDHALMLAVAQNIEGNDHD